MTWLDAPGLERRPVVFVEDHLYHTTDMLAAIAATRPALLAQCTVCGIDRAGPDTVATVRDWRRAYPDLQVVAAGADRTSHSLPLDSADLTDAAAFARLVARLLRPGGVLVQDVQLTTLAFLPADRWWESIYVAATVRGLFAERPPVVRFLSNKRGYAATFGRELAEAGFDPRDVMDKAEIGTVVVPAVAAIVDRAFPLTLEGRMPATSPRAWRVSEHDSERDAIEHAFDLVLWENTDDFELCGRLVAPARADGRLPLRVGANETETWQQLIDDRITAGPGLPVAAVGARIGPPHAERAELTNLAARHLHTLRSRLTDATAIITADHAYRVSDRLSVGRVLRTTSGRLR